MKVFVAGATGAVGLPLVRVLCALGHQVTGMTWLPRDPAKIIESTPADTRLHREGGANLLSAAQALGVKRYILQSRGFFLDAKAGQLADETAKLRRQAPGPMKEGMIVMSEYEDRVLSSALEGVVLRYGFFYGPGTWYRPGGAIADQLKDLGE